MAFGPVDPWLADPGESVTLSAPDGDELHLERFLPSGAEPDVVLVFLHGIGAYAGPFRRFARQLTSKGCGVYLADIRGHARSGGRIGDMGSPAAILMDIQSVLECARMAHPGSEVILGGESMGGLMALAYAASALSAPDRLLLLCPALRPRWRFVPWRPGQGFPLQSPASRMPRRNPDFRRATLSDPRMLQHGSVRYLSVIARFLVAWELRYPAKVAMPVLILQGAADEVLSMSAARTLERLLPHGELRVIPSAWHNLLWDPTWESTTALVADWLIGRIARPESKGDV